MKLDAAEALRYLGVTGTPDPELEEQVRVVAARLEASVAPRYAYRVLDLEPGPRLAGVALPGALAGRMLADCKRAAVLVCTLGGVFDRLLAETQARDMAQAVILDACGGALVEAGCDAAQAELQARLPGAYLTDRFSPGYGDLPLALQGELCALVDARRRLGVHVLESFMLQPTKSVSALIGIADTPQPARVRGCAYCSMRDTCTRKRGGKSCGS